MSVNYNNCVSDQYSAIMSHPQSSRLEVSARYHEYPELRRPLKAFTCKVQANKVSQLLRGGYYEFQVTVARTDSSHPPATFTHRYSNLHEFFLGLRCQFPYVLLPHFPPKETTLYPSNLDAERLTERIRDLQTFFENIFENGLVSPEGLLRAIRDFKPDKTRLAALEARMAEVDRELKEVAPHLSQQLETYRSLNPDLPLLSRLTARAEKLSRYFRFLKERSYKVRTALAKLEPRDSQEDPPLDIEVSDFCAMATKAARLAKESRNFLDAFERGFRMVARWKKVVAPRNGFEVGSRCVSEAFGYGDLTEDVRRELELDMHWTEYASAIEADALVFPQFTEEEKKELGVLEAQLHDFVLGVVNDLRVMLREAVALAGPRGAGLA